MLSMSMDCVESKSNGISAYLKDINKQFQQPLVELDIKQVKATIRQVIAEMYELDDMVHEPSYQSNCLIEYWTLQSLNSCCAELKEILDLLEGGVDDTTFSEVRTKLTDEIHYLWEDCYLDDLKRWEKQVLISDYRVELEKIPHLNGEVDIQSEIDHAVDLDDYAPDFEEDEKFDYYQPLFAKPASNGSGYGLNNVKNNDEQELENDLDPVSPRLRT